MRGIVICGGNLLEKSVVLAPNEELRVAVQHGLQECRATAAGTNEYHWTVWRRG
jgi:hypothetical protein